MPALIKRTLEQNEAIIDSGARWFIDVGNSLMDIRDRELWKKSGRESFEEYAKGRFGFSIRHTYRLIESAIVIRDLKPSDQLVTPVPENESQARALAESADDAKTRQTIWTTAVKTAPKGTDGKPHVTAAGIKKAGAAITGKNGHATNGHAKSGPSPIPARETPKAKAKERLPLDEALSEYNSCIEEIQALWPLEQMDILPARLRKSAAEIEKGLA